MADLPRPPLTSWFRELRRAAAVRRVRAHENSTSADLERFVHLAADAFGAPIAILSLVDGAGLQVRAKTGVDMTRIDRCDSFCHHVLDSRDGLLEVVAPEQDARFRRLPSVVGAPNVRYYLGAPLRLYDGADIGAICVLDQAERAPASADQRAYMRALARQAAAGIEARAELTRAAA